MTEQEAFEKYRELMVAIAYPIASAFTPSGERVSFEDAGGDEFGYEFAVHRGADVALVRFTITPSTEREGAGNLAFRAHGETDELFNWGPDNYTDECWADYDDTDAWAAKLRAVWAEVDTIMAALKTWKTDVATASSPMAP